jgi:hypothetical protein
LAASSAFAPVAMSRLASIATQPINRLAEIRRINISLRAIGSGAGADGRKILRRLIA